MQDSRVQQEWASLGSTYTVQCLQGLNIFFSSLHRKAVHHFSRRRCSCKAGQLLIYLGAETPGLIFLFSSLYRKAVQHFSRRRCRDSGDEHLFLSSGHCFGLQRCRLSRTVHLFLTTHSVRLGNPLVYSTKVQGLRFNICSHQHTRLYSKAGVHHLGLYRRRDSRFEHLV
jgi:hypothetical protein